MIWKRRNASDPSTDFNETGAAGADAQALDTQALDSAADSKGMAPYPGSASTVLTAAPAPTALERRPSFLDRLWAGANDPMRAAMLGAIVRREGYTVHLVDTDDAIAAACLLAVAPQVLRGLLAGVGQQRAGGGGVGQQLGPGGFHCHHPGQLVAHA